VEWVWQDGLYCNPWEYRQESLAQDMAWILGGITYGLGRDLSTRGVYEY